MKRPCSLISSSFSESPSSFSESRFKYDVFLSFRGEDTRYNFTSHLYAALCQKGIHTFKDNQIPKGQPISTELLKTIESSRCSIIVLSGNYPSSNWCLDELVKILECMNHYEQIVLPIFYHVDPSHVRKQIGHFGAAFQKQVLSNSEKVQSWRDALKQVANLAGSHLHDWFDEAKFIRKFSEYVSERLGVGIQSNILGDFVGMDLRLKKQGHPAGMDLGPNELDLNLCPSAVEMFALLEFVEWAKIKKTTLA